MSNARIIVVGPGAMGCGVAAIMQDKGADVALLDYKQQRARQIAADGIHVRFQDREWTARVPISADPEQVGHAGIVLLLVKAYATRAATAHLMPCVTPQTAVVTLQNGLGNYEIIAGLLPPTQVIGGAIVMGATSVDVGNVVISGVGDMAIGSPYGNHGLARETAARLGRYWPSVPCEAAIDRVIWRKVTVNAAVNTLSALSGLTNGAIVADDRLRETLGAIAREVAAVARKTGVEAFADAYPAQVTEEICRITANNRTSMLQDVGAKRPTEIDQICGEIVRRGSMVGVATPLCQAMVALIGSIERAYLPET